MNEPTGKQLKVVPMKLGDAVLVRANVWTGYTDEVGDELCFLRPILPDLPDFDESYNIKEERALHRLVYPNPMSGFVIGKTRLQVYWRVQCEVEDTNRVVSHDELVKLIHRKDISVYEVAFDLRKNTRCYVLPEDLEGTHD